MLQIGQINICSSLLHVNLALVETFDPFLKTNFKDKKIIQLLLISSELF